MYCLFCVVPCIVCVYMCTVLLPPGGYPIAVKYIYIYPKADSSIQNLRNLQAVVTGAHLTRKPTQFWIFGLGPFQTANTFNLGACVKLRWCIMVLHSNCRRNWSGSRRT